MKRNSQKRFRGLEILSNVGRNLRMSPEEYAKKLWDWTALNESFERGIRLTDIDGFVEVGGHFLVIEGKSFSGTLPKGQRIALNRLASLDNFTVIVIDGNPPDEIRGWRVLGKRKYRGDYNEFAAFVRMWFEYADSNQVKHNER